MKKLHSKQRMQLVWTPLKSDCATHLWLIAVLSSQRRTETKLWQWCVLTSPKHNLCLYVHICVCVCALCTHACVKVYLCSMRVFSIYWWITQLWGSQLTSFHPANFHWSLPPLSLCKTLSSCPPSLLSWKKNKKIHKISRLQTAEKEKAWYVSKHFWHLFTRLKIISAADRAQTWLLRAAVYSAGATILNTFKLGCRNNECNAVLRRGTIISHFVNLIIRTENISPTLL